eukprot:1193691-Prorocentrum_minimum.AAC.6
MRGVTPLADSRSGRAPLSTRARAQPSLSCSAAWIRAVQRVHLRPNQVEPSLGRGGDERIERRANRASRRVNQASRRVSRERRGGRTERRGGRVESVAEGESR